MATKLVRNLPLVVRVGVPVIFAGTALYAVRNSGLCSSDNGNKHVLGMRGWTTLKLSDIREETADTRRFVFDFPSADQTAGMSLASAVLMKFKGEKDWMPTIRPYTPISDLDQRGKIEFAIKRYADGPMSSHLFTLKVGDTMDFRGPIPTYKWNSNEFENITLVGGGAGITPLYQLARHILARDDEKTKITLLYGSKSPSDIILRKELDELRAKHASRFKVVYYVDNDDGAASSSTADIKRGYITKDQFEQFAAPPTDNTHVFVCGPPGFTKAISGPKRNMMMQGKLGGILKELGYNEKQVYKF